MQNHAAHFLWPLIKSGLQRIENTTLTYLRGSPFFGKLFATCITTSFNRYYAHFLANPIRQIQDDPRAFEV